MLDRLLRGALTEAALRRCAPPGPPRELRERILVAAGQRVSARRQPAYGWLLGAFVVLLLCVNWATNARFEAQTNGLLGPMPLQGQQVAAADRLAEDPEDPLIARLPSTLVAEAMERRVSLPRCLDGRPSPLLDDEPDARSGKG